MSNYNSLKATINANIKTNGNQEITGYVLNSVLNAMVNTLGAGYQYAGVATPSTNPGTPDAKVFYIANRPGVYSNFGGIVVAKGEVAILKYSTTWSKDVTGCANGSQVEQLLGAIMRILSTESGVVQTSYSNGYINSSGGVSSSSYAKHSDFVPIQSGLLYFVYSTSSDNWHIAYYSAADEGAFISAEPLGATTSEYIKKYLHIPANATHVRISKNTSSSSNFQYISETLVSETLTDSLQDLQNQINAIDTESLDEMVALLSEKTETEVQSTYSNGYINSTGGVSSSSFAKHSDFIQIQSGGKYVLYSKAADNWRIAYYSAADESAFISAQALGSVTTDPININLVIPANATYMRVTKDTTSVSKLLFVVSNLMTTPVPDSLQDLQNQINALGNGKVYVVNPNGGGDYTGLVQALADLKNDETPKTIYVLGGTYDIFNEMGGQAYLDSIPSDVSSSLWYQYSNFVPNNTAIVGLGNVTLNFNVPSGTPQAKMAVVCPLAFRGNITLENLTINASNCRYCIHDETGSTTEKYVKKYRNLKLFKTGGGYTQAYGGGHSLNNSIRFENCVISSNAGPIWSVHDNGNNDNSSIELINCAFVYTGGASVFTALRFSTLNATSGEKFCQINNCSIGDGGKILLEDSSTMPNRYNLVLVKSGNPTIENTSGLNPLTPLVIQ